MQDTQTLLEKIATLEKTIEELGKQRLVVQAARSLMIDLGRGNKDVSFSLQEIHQSLKMLDNKDYLNEDGKLIAAP